MTGLWVHFSRNGKSERIETMRKFGKLNDGSWICQLTAEEVKRLQRREGVRKNAAQKTASVRTILAKIESVFGLPAGCVRFFKPDGRLMYNRNTKIKRILRDFDVE